MKIFSVRGTYAPCGIFTPAHFIALTVCLGMIAGALVLFGKTDKKKFTLMLKILAVGLAALEGVKITFVFLTGDPKHLDSWLPLYFCSLFIFALFFSGFGRGFIKKAGLSFIGGAGALGGLGFLVIPSTSLAGYPIWHFLCLYSLLFHSLMVFTGILAVKIYFQETDLKKWLYYAVFFGIFMSAALVLNTVYGCNMMFLREPYNMPFLFINNMYAFNKPLYTVFMASIYLAVPIVVLTVAAAVKTSKGRNRINVDNNLGEIL